MLEELWKLQWWLLLQNTIMIKKKKAKQAFLFCKLVKLTSPPPQLEVSDPTHCKSCLPWSLYETQQAEEVLLLTLQTLLLKKKGKLETKSLQLEKMKKTSLKMSISDSWFTWEPSDPPGCTCKVVPSPKMSFLVLPVTPQCCTLQKLSRGLIFSFSFPFSSSLIQPQWKDKQGTYCMFQPCKTTWKLLAVNLRPSQ